MVGDPQTFGYEIVSGDRATTTLRLHGELDMAAAPTLRRALHELQHGGGRVVVDLRGLSFLDSMGLSALLEAHDAGRDGHREVSFIAGGRSVQRVFKITKMDERVTWIEPGTLDRGESV